MKARLKPGQINDIEKILKNTYKCSAELCVYEDTYFDRYNMELRRSERELRLRRVIGDCSEKIVLTCKEPPLDQTARSKPEHEVQVNSFEQAADVLRSLGYLEDISFTKTCTNLRLTFQSADITVTLVTMAELNQDFIEAEVLIAATGNLDRTYACLHEFLLSLQIMPEQLTGEYYTEMVRQARGL